jgi:hypothetical protein
VAEVYGCEDSREKFLLKSSFGKTPSPQSLMH